jgi:hypothetical protein
MVQPRAGGGALIVCYPGPAGRLWLGFGGRSIPILDRDAAGR